VTIVDYYVGNNFVLILHLITTLILVYKLLMSFVIIF
jgi:hypothetical protein